MFISTLRRLDRRWQPEWDRNAPDVTRMFTLYDVDLHKLLPPEMFSKARRAHQLGKHVLIDFKDDVPSLRVSNTNGSATEPRQAARQVGIKEVA